MSEDVGEIRIVTRIAVGVLLAMLIIASGCIVDTQQENNLRLEMAKMGFCKRPGSTSVVYQVCRPPVAEAK